MMTMTTIADEHGPRRQVVAAATAGMILLLAGCVAATGQASVPAATSAEYIIRMQMPAGGFGEVGRLLLRADGGGELTVTAGGADAERLRQAWQVVSSRPTLTTKFRDTAGGLDGATVKRGAPDYGLAIADVMSREFGFFLSPRGAR